MAERFYKVEDTIAAIRLMNGRLPAYRRTTPEDWSRIVQTAAFGEIAEKVTDEEYEELINTVRKIREWLKDNGKGVDEHPDYRGSGHEIFWLEDEVLDDTQKYSISVELRPWDKQLAVNLEPYPKFTVEAPVDDYSARFNLNFDDTYCLSVTSGHRPRYAVDYLSRREMTRFEYALVSIEISDTVSHFGIDLSYAARKRKAAEAQA